MRIPVRIIVTVAKTDAKITHVNQAKYSITDCASMDKDSIVRDNARASGCVELTRTLLEGQAVVTKDDKLIDEIVTDASLATNCPDRIPQESECCTPRELYHCIESLRNGELVPVRTAVKDKLKQELEEADLDYQIGYTPAVKGTTAEHEWEIQWWTDETAAATLPATTQQGWHFVAFVLSDFATEFVDLTDFEDFAAFAAGEEDNIVDATYKVQTAVNLIQAGAYVRVRWEVKNAITASLDLLGLPYDVIYCDGEPVESSVPDYVCFNGGGMS